VFHRTGRIFFTLCIHYLCQNILTVAVILHIETATKNCSVSIANTGKILVLKEFNDDSYSHAEKLHTFIYQLWKSYLD